jgi:putative ABC transport system permease protein
VNYVTPTYFETMSLRVIEGRVLSRSDDARLDVVVINQRLARELPTPVIGQSLRFVENGHVAQVVGVVGDVKYECLACPPRPYVFLPLTRSVDARVTVHAQVDGSPSDLVNAARNELQRVTGPGQIPDVQTVAAIVDADLWVSRSSALVVSGLALLIGLLAAVGLYGLTAFRIQRSLRTLAIHAALGARRLDMWRFVARQGLSASAAGGALGLLFGYVGVAELAGVMLGVSPTDPLIYLIVISMLLVTAGCAVAIPARRAMRQDLVSILKDS